MFFFYKYFTAYKSFNLFPLQKSSNKMLISAGDLALYLIYNEKYSRDVAVGIT